MKKYLTLAIPTYNRSAYLRKCLEAVSVSSCINDIDILIINNNSTDDTDDVVRFFKKRMANIRYFKNETNVGAINNVLRCIEKAEGLYTWIIGDDDLIHSEAFCYLDMYLKKENVDFIALPISIIKEKDVKKNNGNVLVQDLISKHRVVRCFSDDDRYTQWEDLIVPEVDGVFLGAIMISIFRTSILKNKMKQTDVSERYMFHDLKFSYPHAYLYGKYMYGRPALYVSKALVSSIARDKEWNKFNPLLVTTRLNQLLDHYREHGVSKKQIARCRKALLKSYSKTFWNIMMQKDKMFRQDFSLRYQIRINYKFILFWKTIIGIENVRILQLKKIKKLIQKFRK